MRLKTLEVKIGNITIGGKNPVMIQSMTNTDTSDVKATVKQFIELADAGSEMVRVTVDNEKSAQAISKIRSELNKKGYKNIPLIGDFHFNGHKLLKEYPDCAKALDKYRINPGNVGFGKSHDENFADIIKIAIKNKKPIRIGVNIGSLDKELPKRMSPVEAMVESAISSAKYAEKLGLKRNQIVLSVKMTDVKNTIKAYEFLAEKMKKQKRIYALHLGLTEAGSDIAGITSSTAALSILLQKGIGDTIRVSITPNEKANRTDEVKVCKNILQALELRRFSPRVISCPGCGRTNNEIFQKLVKEVSDEIEKLQKKNSNLKNIKIAVMGCIVNGPGEAKEADIAIVIPGKNESKKALIYVKNKLQKTIEIKNIKMELLKILENM